MTTNLPQLTPGMIQLPAALAGLGLTPGSNDLSQGVGGMPVISIRGRMFRLKYRGQEVQVTYTAQDGQKYPMPYLDVLTIKGSPVFSKIYYQDAYAEGDDNQPDCFSINGVTPDPSSPKIQCATCAACQWNVWGSKTTPQGTKVKACQDSRRLAVVPAGDPMNEAWGGPMLLRVPPASLQDLAIFGNQMAAAGVAYQAVICRLGWDMDVAYPKLTFTYQGPIGDVQAAAIAHWYNHEQVQRILSSAEAIAPVSPVPNAQPPVATPPVGQPLPVTNAANPYVVGGLQPSAYAQQGQMTPMAPPVAAPPPPPPPPPAAPPPVASIPQGYTQGTDGRWYVPVNGQWQLAPQQPQATPPAPPVAAAPLGPTLGPNGSMPLPPPPLPPGAPPVPQQATRRRGRPRAETPVALPAGMAPPPAQAPAQAPAQLAGPVDQLLPFGATSAVQPSQPIAVAVAPPPAVTGQPAPSPVAAAAPPPLPAGAPPGLPGGPPPSMPVASAPAELSSLLQSVLHGGNPPG